MNQGDLLTTVEIRDPEGRVTGAREVVRYDALLNAAHNKGLKSIETRLKQCPSQGNGLTAIASARVTLDSGVFTALANASPENTNSRVGAFLIETAETRAKARALRDALNIGTVSLEELPDGSPGDGTSTPETVAEASRGATKPYPTPNGAPANPNGPASPMTDAQRRYLFRLLAAREIRGEAAQDELKRRLGVESLAQATKQAASALIEELAGSGSQ